MAFNSAFKGLMCSSEAETLSHLLPELFGEELCYYEEFTAFEMK